KYEEGMKLVPFRREELAETSIKLGFRPPKNLGDIVYSFRHRTALPKSIIATEPEGLSWIIRTTSSAEYVFALTKSSSRIIPSEGLVLTKIPDAVPSIVVQHALDDEQALLTLIRYNRLIDTFLGVSAYSLQNHLRTTIGNGVQVETDELYAGVDRNGVQYVIPVQAKGGKDEIGIIQIEQDLMLCQEKFPDLIPRQIAAQFLDRKTVAMFELGIQDELLVKLRESHYRLVPASEITSDDLALYQQASASLE